MSCGYSNTNTITIIDRRADDPDGEIFQITQESYRRV
jgi:hypothetical protein